MTRSDLTSSSDTARLPLLAQNLLLQDLPSVSVMVLSWIVALEW